MAASRMSRIPNRNFSFLFLMSLVICITTALGENFEPEEIEETELITAPKTGQEFISLHASGASPSDGKKNPGSKAKKIYQTPKPGYYEKRVTEIPIKDAKDSRLLRLISEGLLIPQDTLPVTPSSTPSSDIRTLHVNVQPEGMTGFVTEGLSIDSTEAKIMGKKRDGTTEATVLNNEKANSLEGVKIDLEGNKGIKRPNFTTEEDTIGVPEQKHISLTKRKDIDPRKLSAPPQENSYDTVPVRKEANEKIPDEGAFDFVDSSYVDRRLLSSPTAQTSRISVKKGPNGQDYEYEYVYYYYDDEEEKSNLTGADRSPKPVENVPAKSTTSRAPVTYASPSRPTTTISPPPQLPPAIAKHAPTYYQQPIPDQDPNIYRYDRPTSVSTDQLYNHGTYDDTASNDLSSQVISQKNSGRQLQNQGAVDNRVQPTQDQQRFSDERLPQNTRFPARGRASASSPSVENTPSNVLQVPSQVSHGKDSTVSKQKGTGVNRQPGLDLVDNSSFRTHPTNRPPASYDGPQQQVPSQKFAVGEQVPVEQGKFTSAEKLPPPTTRKEDTAEYATQTESISTILTTKMETVYTLSGAQAASSDPGLSSIYSDTRLPSTNPEILQTVSHTTGFTDKAAHDLYAILQQTRNEEVTQPASQESRPAASDEEIDDSYAQKSPSLPSSTTTTSTTTTTTPATTTPVTTTTTTSTTTVATPIVPSVPAVGKGRYRNNGLRSRVHTTSTTTTEFIPPSSEQQEEVTQKPKSRFQPSHQRPTGDRVSVYGRRGYSTTSAPSEEPSSKKDQEASRSGWSGPTRTRYRNGGPVKTETSTESLQQSSTISLIRPNFAERFNSRQRGKQRTTTPPPQEEEDPKEENVEQSSSEPSTTKPIRSRVTPEGSSRIRPLRPGPKINLSPRGRISTTTTQAPPPPPSDSDADNYPEASVEGRHGENEENGQNIGNDDDNEDAIQVSNTTTTTTPIPDALTRLRNRPRLQVREKSTGAKQGIQSDQVTTSSQNRRQLISNLLPKKQKQKQPQQTPPPQQDDEEHEEKVEPKPVEEESPEESNGREENYPVVSPVVPEPSTTESRLSSLLASRRRNISGRRPGPSAQPNRQQIQDE